MAVRKRDPEKTRTHLLQVGFQEIYQNGFQGVSVDQIVGKSSVTKGAFFHYFPTKSDLGYAIVDEFLREMILERWIRPLAAYPNPVQGILNRFKKNIVAWPEENLIRGCPLNNLSQEMSAVDPVFREKLQVVMNLWIDETEKYLKKAKTDGYLKKTVQTKQLAQFIVTLQEGTYAMAKTLGDRKVFDSLYGSLRAHLEILSSSPTRDDVRE